MGCYPVPSTWRAEGMLGWLDKSPKDIHILTPRTCGFVTLHGKKDFADVIELRTLEMER